MIGSFGDLISIRLGQFGWNNLQMLAINREAYLANCQSAGASMETISYASLFERLPSNGLNVPENFIGVLRNSFDAAKLVDPHKPALTRISFGQMPRDRSLFMFHNVLGRVLQFEDALRFLFPNDRKNMDFTVLDETLLLGAHLLAAPLDWSPQPVTLSVSLDEAANILLGGQWPVYVGHEKVETIVGDPPYRFGVHDLNHFGEWSRSTSADRCDAVFFYRFLKEFFTHHPFKSDFLNSRRELDIALELCLNGPRTHNEFIGSYHLGVLVDVLLAYERDANKSALEAFVREFSNHIQGHSSQLKWELALSVAPRMASSRRQKEFAGLKPAAA